MFGELQLHENERKALNNRMIVKVSVVLSTSFVVRMQSCWHGVFDEQR